MSEQTTTSNPWGIELPGIPLEIEVKPVRRLNLRVRSDGTAHLSVPLRTSSWEVALFLHEHEQWLREKISQHRRLAEESKDGLIPLWGRLVPLPEGAEPDDVYFSELVARLPEVATCMEREVGAYAARWQPRAMTSRWGSCNPSTARISINVRLAAYPPTCLEYIVVHELTHLLEPSHNKRFHTLLARVYPDERAASALLRRPARDVATDR